MPDESTQTDPVPPRLVARGTTGDAARRPLIDLFPSPHSAAAPSSASSRASVRHEPATAEPIAPATFPPVEDRPFAAEPDIRFLYHSASHDRAVRELLAGLDRGDPVVAAVGARGMGKTMLCRALSEAVDRRTVVSFAASSASGVHDFLYRLLVDFGVITRSDLARGGLTSASTERLLTTLADFVTSIAAIHAIALVIVDDAQAVPIEILETLGELSGTASGGPVLRTALIADGSLRDVLARPELATLAGSVGARVALEPLAPDEIVPYVARRIAVAGAGGLIEFDEKTSARIFEMTGGVPLAVNVLAGRALDVARRESLAIVDAHVIAATAEDLGLRRRSRARWRRRAAVGAVVLALAIAAAAAAAIVFHERLERALTRWEHRPPAPSAPPLRLAPQIAPVRTPPLESPSDHPPEPDQSPVTRDWRLGPTND